MEPNIKLALDKILHDSATAELRLLHKGTVDSNLTYNDILYLSIIQAHSGEYTASNLADLLHVSRPGVTQKINELEKRGYIYKVQSPTDKRVFKLFTNRQGTAKDYYSVTDQTSARITEKISADYTKEELALFCQMTDKICKILLEETKRGDL